MRIPIQQPRFIREPIYLLIGYLMYLGLRLSVLENVRTRAAYAGVRKNADAVMLRAVARRFPRARPSNLDA